MNNLKILGVIVLFLLYKLFEKSNDIVIDYPVVVLSENIKEEEIKTSNDEIIGNINFAQEYHVNNRYNVNDNKL